MATEVKQKSDLDYQVEDGARTLIRAEEIKQDKKLYPLCLKEMEKQHNALMRAMGRGDGKTLKDMLKNMNEED